MFHRILVPVAAGLLFLFATLHALYIQSPKPNPPPPVPPPTTPFGTTVTGAGMIEPSHEASTTSVIAVGSQLAGLVTAVPVRIGQEVKTGCVLFELDRSLTLAQLKVNEAQQHVAEATVVMNRDARDRGRSMLPSGAIAEQDMVTLEQSLRVSTNQVELAKAQVQQTRTQLDLLSVRAPLDGTILQVNIRPGEYVTTSATQNLIVMGPLKPLHVRVNIDEEDLPRLRLNAPARAKLRGDALQQELPLTFVRLEPYVVPKVSMTGINVERVDTRVAQVIYALDPDHPLVQAKNVLVGQLVDVFIDTQPISSSAR